MKRGKGLQLLSKYGTINVLYRKDGYSMPIVSKKQSQAKQNWLKENSKIFGVRVMKKTEQDIWEYLQGKEASAVFKAALREYMERHPDEGKDK